MPVVYPSSVNSTTNARSRTVSKDEPWSRDQPRLAVDRPLDSIEASWYYRSGNGRRCNRNRRQDTEVGPRMNTADFDTHVENINRDGYTVLPGMLTRDECDAAQAELVRLSADKDRGGLECLFNKARVFERVYQIPDLLCVIRHFLGPDAILSTTDGSILEPGKGGGGLHADGALTGHLQPSSQAAADSALRITSHAMGLNTIFCISDFNLTNGATRLMPGSHACESIEIPQTASDQARIAVAERGSTIVFNTNTWHGPSENRSTQNRYAVLATWRRSWEKAPYEMSRIVNPDVLERAGDEGGVMFGVEMLPPYLERWQWDRKTGAPRPEFADLRRD